MFGELSRLARRILNVAGRGRITTVKDDGPAQMVQVKLGGEEVRDDTPRIAEYGFVSNPPPDSDAVVVCLGGDRTNTIVIATNNKQYRLTGLGSGDVAIHDNRGQCVILGPDNIHIVGNVLLSGNLVVSGSTEFLGTVIANGHPIDETHIHHLGSGFTGNVA